MHDEVTTIAMAVGALVGGVDAPDATVAHPLARDALLRLAPTWPDLL